MKKLLVSVIAIFVLASCSTASELPPGPVTPIVPPPGAGATRPAQAAVTPQAPSGAPAPVVFPQQPPAAQRGQTIYDARCAACHGATGKGDGAQSQQIVAAMGGKLPNFTDAAYVRAIKPADWFDAISNGRMQKGMPPFASLSVDERWDVTAYLYTFAIPPAQLDLGKSVYADKCAACHGATGKSDKPGTPDLSDLSKMALQSQAEFDAVIAGGKGAMPSYATVSQSDRQAAADYVRSLSMPLGKVAAPSGQASIVGALVNGTLGAKSPSGLPVTLYALTPDGANLMYTRTARSDAGGRFAFDQLDGAAPLMYGLQVQYLKATYTSEPLTLAHGGLTLTVPITVYETTADVSGLRVEQMHMFFDYGGPDSVTVGQLFIMSNSGDRAYIGADGASVKFSLPRGAANVSFMDGELGGRYQALGDGFADTEAVAPGVGTVQILVSYDLPYDGKKLDVNLPMAYPVKSVNVLVPEGGAKLTSPQLNAAGTRPTQSGNMVNFVGGGIAAGQSLALQLAGAIAPAPMGAAAQASQPVSPILIVAAALLLVAVAIVAFVWLRQRRETEWVEAEVEEIDADARQDELLTAIAALDDDFEAGRLGEAEYRRQRGELKAELKELMKGA